MEYLPCKVVDGFKWHKACQALSVGECKSIQGVVSIITIVISIIVIIIVIIPVAEVL